MTHHCSYSCRTDYESLPWLDYQSPKPYKTPVYLKPPQESHQLLSAGPRLPHLPLPWSPRVSTSHMLKNNLKNHYFQNKHKQFVLFFSINFCHRLWDFKRALPAKLQLSFIVTGTPSNGFDFSNSASDNLVFLRNSSTFFASSKACGKRSSTRALITGLTSFMRLM